jgi:hypothetical protein
MQSGKDENWKLRRWRRVMKSSYFVSSKKEGGVLGVSFCILSTVFCLLSLGLMAEGY